MTTTAITKEQLWAKNLPDEQLAARLIAVAGDLKWLTIPQRTALWHEAAARIFKGTPTLGEAPLPSQREVDEANGADAARPADQEAPAERAPRGRKSGDPRADRTAQAERDALDARVIDQLRTYARAVDARTVAAGMEGVSYAKVAASLRRLAKNGRVVASDGKYQAAVK